MTWHRELHPIKEGHRVYRFVTTLVDSLPLYGRMANHPDCVMCDSKGVIRAEIKNHRLFWTVGYAWNGCSPKRYVGFPPIGCWLGTPDPLRSRRGSLGHDILFQFAGHGKYDFDDANHQFFEWMKDDNFALAEHYYDAVEMFGRKFWTKDESLTVEFL